MSIEPLETDETKSFKLRRSPEAMLAVFTETNEHMRNAEQKQLNVTGAYSAWSQSFCRCCLAAG